MYTFDDSTNNNLILKEDEAIYNARSLKEKQTHEHNYKLIDLFSGAGGMSLGFSKEFGHPFKSVWANDFNKFCVNTYNKNFGPHCVHGDIVDILENDNIQIPQAEVVIGGPPCQGFSLLNKNRDNDPRKKLWKPFLDVVAQSGAEIFVMENVPQLLGTLEHSEIIDTSKSLGFKVWQDKLLAADYGVPQTRTRAFIIGCKFVEPSILFPPRKTHFKDFEIPKQMDLNLNKTEYLPNPER